MARLEAVARALRIILYLRISDLTDTSTSIPRQEKACRAKAETLGGEVVAAYKDEDKSGYHTHVERPAFNRALADLRERKADVLVVFKVDRATRQGIPQASEIIRLVYETGCRFISVSDGIDSEVDGWELQLTIAAHQAHRESKNTALRVADMRAHERDEARWMGQRPYGFRVTPERKLEIHPEEAEIVRAMVARLLDGHSLHEVARWLNDQQYDSPRWASHRQRIAQLEAKGEPLKAQRLREKPMKHANSWSWSAVRQLVTSPTMTGYLPYNDEIYRHSETGQNVRVGPEIVSMADWTRLRANFWHDTPPQLKRAATPGQKSQDSGRKIRGLLIDFLHCGECGSRMTCDMSRLRNGEMSHRYRCTRRRRAGRCPGVVVQGHTMDALVGSTVLHRLSALDYDDPAVLAVAQRWADQQHPERAARRAELEALIREEEQFLDRLEDEKLNGLFIGSRGEARFKRRYEASNERLTNYETELATIPDSQSLNVSFMETAELVAEAWDSSSLAEQRDFLRLVLERAWIFKPEAAGKRLSLDRVVFWFVGEPEPQGIGAPLSLAAEEPRRAPSAREAHDLYETEDQAARIEREERLTYEG